MRRYRLPILSGVLLALVFYPFYLWPLVFVALAPLFYFARSRPRRELFLGGAITGAIVAAPTLYFTLFSLALQPGAPILTYTIRASSLFFLILIACLFGLLTLLLARTRGSSVLLNALWAALGYTAIELLLFDVFQGYNYISLGLAAPPLPVVLHYAAWGGVPLVALLIAYINGLVAERAWVALVVALVLLSVPAMIPRQTPHEQRSISLAVVQVAGGVPSESQAEQLIVQAATGADLVVYPYSPDGKLISNTQDAQFGAKLASQVSTSTTVVVWNTLQEQGRLYDQLAFWKAGASQVYRKRKRYAFSDYTPAVAHMLGARLPLEITPGTTTQVTIDGASVGVLICSELHQPELLQGAAKHSSLVLSVGWDVMFPNDLAGNFSIAAAQFRAAEGGVWVLRATLPGPSVLVAPDGTVTARLPFEKSGVLRARVPLEN